MSPRKKDPAKQAAEDATVAFAHEKVAANPRGAPEVIPAVWEDVHPVATVQRLVEAPVVGPTTPCAIATAPIGAKCVVSRTDEGKAVRLLTPAGVETLDKSDLCYTLPSGAKIQRTGEATFAVYRLGVQEGPLFIATSAPEAVALFLKAVA